MIGIQVKFLAFVYCRHENPTSFVSSAGTTVNHKVCVGVCGTSVIFLSSVSRVLQTPTTPIDARGSIVAVYFIYAVLCVKGPELIEAVRSLVRFVIGCFQVMLLVFLYRQSFHGRAADVVPQDCHAISCQLTHDGGAGEMISSDALQSGSKSTAVEATKEANG